MQNVADDATAKILIVPVANLSSDKLEATWAAAEAGLTGAGAKQIGLQDATLEQVQAVLAMTGGRAKPVCNIVELHPLRSQRKLVGTCMRKVCSWLHMLLHVGQGLINNQHTRVHWYKQTCSCIYTCSSAACAPQPCPSGHLTMSDVQGVQCIAHSAAPADLLEGSSQPADAVAKVAAGIDQSSQAVLHKWSMQRGVPVVLEEGGHVAEADKCFSWRLDEERGKVRMSDDVKLVAFVHDLQRHVAIVNLSIVHRNAPILVPCVQALLDTLDGQR